jgi:hypothetical protein
MNGTRVLWLAVANGHGHRSHHHMHDDQLDVFTEIVSFDGVAIGILGDEKHVLSKS